MRSGGLERKLLWAVLGLFVFPTLVVEVVLVALYRRGTFEDSRVLLGVVLNDVGFTPVDRYYYRYDDYNPRRYAEQDAPSGDSRRKDPKR